MTKLLFIAGAVLLGTAAQATVNYLAACCL
jgi:hypothetical protein